jgi:hypothetical protein
MRKFMYYLIFSMPGFMPMQAISHELGAHVHGIATLQIAVDTKTLTLDFSSPLDNLIGFEHESRNQVEVDKVQNMINTFYKANLFVPTPSAQCQLKTIDLQSLVIKKKPNVPKPQHEEPEGHADLDAELIYTCNNINNLRDLQVNMFKTFPNLRQLSTEIVSEHGQAAVKLTPLNTLAAW